MWIKQGRDDTEQWQVITNITEYDGSHIFSDTYNLTSATRRVIEKKRIDSVYYS